MNTVWYILKHLQRKALAKTENLFQIEVHAVEHCNLNCASCSHFSCVAEKGFLAPASFEKDLARLAELTAQLAIIKILGGEPLLYPPGRGGVTVFFDIARKYFKNTPLMLTTNGMLLKKQKPDFWENCRKNNVIISISNYPIKLDRQGINKLGRTYHVAVRYNESPLFFRVTKDVFTKMPLDLNGSQSIDENYRVCKNHRGICTTLRDGKIFQCATAAHILHFNKYFHTNLEITEQDYIDIYKAQSKEEIVAFLRKPFPFCRYCRPGATAPVNWKVTGREINEWT
jgi:MoaA/NifB/PqqE/SkfB family radical SAM enzyme